MPRVLPTSTTRPRTAANWKAVDHSRWRARQLNDDIGALRPQQARAVLTPPTRSSLISSVSSAADLLSQFQPPLVQVNAD